MLEIQAIAPPGQILQEDVIVDYLTRSLEKHFTRQKVLVLIPDHTRSLPLPFLFRTLVGILKDTARLDFMVALGNPSSTIRRTSQPAGGHQRRRTHQVLTDRSV